jgi:hypothetical protein
VRLSPAIASLAAIAALAALAALALPPRVMAATPELRLPDFDHLRSKATETVEVDVGGFLLALAKRFTRQQAHEEPALKLLQDIDSVKVRSFKFDHDDAYSKADVDVVRKQLTGPEWSAIAQVHKREPRENVDVFLCVEEGRTCGLAVIAAQARELTIVNIVGSIDIDRLGELEGEFGIPKVGENE